MTTFSKFFAEYIQSRSCQDIIHSGTCSQHLFKDVTLYALSNLKYFAPICLLPALIKMSNMDKQKLRKTVKYYLECSAVGTCIGYSINLLICCIRGVYGQFSYYSILFVPTLLGSNLLYLGSERIISLFQTSVFQCTLETFLFMRNNLMSRVITSSKALQTGLFMTCSAIILHCKQTYKSQGFWLLVPNPQARQTNNVKTGPKCDMHPRRNCQEYIVHGMRKYFVLGLSLDVIKMLLSPVNSTQNRSKLIGKIKNFRLRSTTLLTAYIGIYRFANCWLNRKTYFSRDCNHNLSSFIAGCCYYLYPQSTLFSYAIVQAILGLWKIITVKNLENKNKAATLLFAIPYAKILFPFAVATMVHLTVMQPKCTSHLGAAIVNGVTNDYPNRIHREVRILKDKFRLEGNH